MDLHTVQSRSPPRRADEIVFWKPRLRLAGRRHLAFLRAAAGRAYADRPRVAQLAGTSTFPGRPRNRRDLQGRRARPIRLPGAAQWKAAPLFRQCCRSLLASFKIWNEATVGGNICMSLPAGPDDLADGGPRRRLHPLADGRRTAGSVRASISSRATTAMSSRPANCCARIFLPAYALRKKTFAFRRFSLTHLGRSEVLLIGTRCPEHGRIPADVTAATLRPVQLRFECCPPLRTETRDRRRGAVRPVPRRRARLAASPQAPDLLLRRANPLGTRP